MNREEKEKLGWGGSIYGLFMKCQSATKALSNNKEGEQVWQEYNLFLFLPKSCNWHPPPPPNVKRLNYTVNIVILYRQIWIRYNGGKSPDTIQCLTLIMSIILLFISV